MATLTVEDIAAEASVSLQAFYVHFESKEDAFLVAYELGHATRLRLCRAGFRRSPQLAHRRARRPLQPDGLPRRRAAFRAAVADGDDRGDAACQRALQQGYGGLRASFWPRASRRRPSACDRLQITLEATVGGLQEIFLHYAVQGRIHDLPELTADATYVALAPFIGAQEAAEVAARIGEHLTKPPRAPGLCQRAGGRHDPES